MYKRSILCILFLVACLSAIVLADEYTREVFDEKYKAVITEEEVGELCGDFINNASDIDVIRRAQDRWRRDDIDAARSFCEELLKSDINSAKFTYLYGRVAESPVEKIKLGRKAIALDAEWPYGYRLLLATYVSDLFNADDDDPDAKELANMLEEDLGYFTKLAELQPEESYPHEYVYKLNVYQKNYDKALELLDKGKAAEARWASDRTYAYFYALTGKYDQSLEKIDAMLEERKAQGTPDDEIAEYRDYYYARALRNAGSYGEMINYYQAKEDFTTNAEAHYDVACAYNLTGDVENAFKSLQTAVELGWDKAGSTQKEEDLEPLKDDSRWQEIIAGVKSNWVNGASERKEEALKEKLDESAPDWSLPDKDGNMVNLADFKGKVIVLDFWATWCGPCRRTMPTLNKFIRNDAHDDVVVFSICVWEKGRKKQIKYMDENDYAMTLLYGNDELVKLYGISGIPTLVVIDKEGNIRYKETGYSEALSDYLIYWTEDLL
ncbi:MAG: TlpA disulfide reductase family protein [candidate division Zixibacteria bacterium]